MKVAGAPISWGVNELPDWGHRMPPERVLAEMHQLGLEATELGPPGYLPEDAASRRDLLDRNGLRLCAGFLAAVLHDPSRTPRDEIEHEATALAGSGAEVLVLAAALPGDTYDTGRRLTPAEWACLAERVSEAADVSQSHGLELAVHLHAGTAIATADDLRILVDTTRADLCLDTGHMFLGGVDPVAVARDLGRRVKHVHLKDVDARLAERVNAGEMVYAEAVRRGLYRPLGQGDIDVDAVVGRLREAGYTGWFVLEQDTALTAEPEPGAGPSAQVRESLEYFRRIGSAKQAITASKEE